MSADVITHTADASRGQGRRGYSNKKARGGNNAQDAPPTNRGSNNRNNRAKKNNIGTDIQNNREPTEQESTTTIAAPQSETGGDSDVCWICAEPVKYYSLSECNHRTCHVCAIRLRALYKKTDCTFCKVPQTVVIFTVSPDAPFSYYTTETMQFKDLKLSVYFETQEMMEDTLILLRFNCPDSECAYIGNGWNDLKLHVRATHGKIMCELCIKHKKVFSHEHALYPPALLPVHLPSWGRPNKVVSKEPVEGGIHPRCGFCKDCFFGDDELYSHMRERHEECFICKRNGIRDQYFENYESLERHFYSAHHPCTHGECLARKFVVFDTALDLKVHTVEDHGGDMSSRDKKDARRVQADFAFEEVGGRHGHGRRDRERDRERERDRDPLPQAPPPPRQHQAQASLSSAATTVPPPGSGARRREAFGGGLTQAGETENNNRGISRPSTPQATTDIDQAVIERHAKFLTRLQSLTTNPTTAVPAIKAATRGYRLAETTARDLILTIWNVVDQKLEHTASIVNAFVDLVDEEEKKQDILTSWKSFEIEQRRQFPELVPSSFGSEYAGITSGRVLNAKHSSATRSSSQSSQQQVWNRVALAAESSLPSTQTLHRPVAVDRFPVLSGSSSAAHSSSASSSFPGSGFRQPQRSTPWSGSSAAASSRSTPLSSTSTSTLSLSLSSSSSKSTTKNPPPKLSSTLFPELPSLAASRTKPQVSGNVSLKNILGSTSGPAVSAWRQSSYNSSIMGDGGGGGGLGNTAVVLEGQGEVRESPAVSGDATATAVTTQTKGRKEKGKQKQTLFTIGSLVT